MLKIHEIMRAQNVSRWSLIATTRQQSVAEHTFNVVMLVRAMAKLMYMKDEQLIKAALEHDLDEVITGDIPSPTKATAKQLGMDLGLMEGPKKNEDALSGQAKSLLKIADIIDAVHFLDNFGTGRRAAVVQEELTDVLYAMIDAFADDDHDVADALHAFVDSVLNGEAV